MTEPTPVSTIAHLIQLAIAPVFLLAGIGAILNVLANRLARIVDRVRSLEAGFLDYDEEERQRVRKELWRLDKRMRLVNASITTCTASALFVCLVVALLFVADLGEVRFGTPVALLFILAMAFLIVALVLFLLEIQLAAKSLRIRQELLELPPED
jgi:hypothetical protein